MEAEGHYVVRGPLYLVVQQKAGHNSLYLIHFPNGRQMCLPTTPSVGTYDYDHPSAEALALVNTRGLIHDIRHCACDYQMVDKCINPMYMMYAHDM